MNKKKIMHVPDDLYEMLGFTLPISKDKEYSEYVKGESIVEFIGGQRVNTLKRESTYRTYYPKLQAINLLALNYSFMPQHVSQQAVHIRKVIRKKIFKSFASISPEKKVNSECEEYVKGILSLYGDLICAKWMHYNSGEELDTAFKVLNTRDLICISFSHRDNSIVYADPFCKKKLNGYYYLRSEPSTKVHIIDLVDFLVDILLIQAINHIQATIQLPIIQDIFEKFIHTHSDSAINSREYFEIDILMTSLISKKPLPYDRLFCDYSYNNENRFILGLSNTMFKKLIGLFGKVLEVYQDIQYENKHRDEMAKTVATAYMTKKNIPQNILKAMEHTPFKKYFKYVEFDEDIDLDTVKLIEKEFMILNEAYFSSKAFFDVKLRFRKLGKHKASGLYYPTLHTLCVDLRSPSSFIHEYFHMLDDQMGDLSLGKEFQNIAEEYRQVFLNNLEQLEASIQTQLNGQGKYNLQYFFRRAEIFARCGEIYFVRILNVESSLIQPDLKYAYPQSERLDNLIQHYYENLLHVKLKQSDFAEAV